MAVGRVREISGAWLSWGRERWGAMKLSDGAGEHVLGGVAGLSQGEVREG